LYCERCKKEVEDERDLCHCSICHRDICKECSVDIISDIICEDCYNEGSW
jgi:hypothetical protein